MKYILLNCSILLTLLACKQTTPEKELYPILDFTPISLLGDTLKVSPPSSGLMSRYDSIKSMYSRKPNDPDHMIWMGRFEAYIGNYPKAFEIFGKGIEQFPEDPRFYRHRGHRFITIRKFDLAIADLEKAASLIEGTENKTEPDGMPNAMGIPVSTLHGNIWYHLGLAYYLKQDWDKALDAYLNCLNSAAIPDNVVSASHWLYMISRRMGKSHEVASLYLEPVNLEMEIIENFAYLKTCLFYKGELKVSELIDESDAASANDAILYGLANWYNYNGQLEAAKEIYRQILERDSWNSFGFIAAEADWLKF